MVLGYSYVKKIEKNVVIFFKSFKSKTNFIIKKAFINQIESFIKILKKLSLFYVVIDKCIYIYIYSYVRPSKKCLHT